MLTPGDARAVLMKKAYETDKKLVKTSKIHSAMLTHVVVKVKGGARQPRPGILGVVAEPEPHIDVFTLQSPAMARVDSTVDSIHPFWAVLRSQEGNHVSNMGFEELCFTDNGVALKSGSKGTFPDNKNKVELVVSLPMMHNSKQLNYGDVLCLPPFVPAVVGT